MSALILLLRLLHIVGGAFWVGAVILTVFFIEPTAGELGPAGDRFMAHLVRRRAALVMAIAAITALGAGAALYWIDSGGLRLEWISTHTGIGFTVGGIAALIAFAIAGIFLKPGVDRFAAMPIDDTSSASAAPEPDHGELERFERRFRRWSLIQVSLLLLAIAAMATARYLP
jgi:hypothetical protein